jgi:hypothetical protein
MPSQLVVYLSKVPQSVLQQETCSNRQNIKPSTTWQNCVQLRAAICQADSNASFLARYGDMRCRGRLRGSKHRNSSTVAHQSTRPAYSPPFAQLYETSHTVPHTLVCKECNIRQFASLTNPAQLRQEAGAGGCLSCWGVHLQGVQPVSSVPPHDGQRADCTVSRSRGFVAS